MELANVVSDHGNLSLITDEIRLSTEDCTSLVVLEESPCPRGFSKTNLQVHFVPLTPLILDQPNASPHDRQTELSTSTFRLDKQPGLKVQGQGKGLNFRGQGHVN